MPTEKNFNRLGGVNQASVHRQRLRLLQLIDLPNKVALPRAVIPSGVGDKERITWLFSP